MLKDEQEVGYCIKRWDEKRLFLHADLLEIYNPILKKKMSFKSTAPKAFIAKVKEK